MEVSRLEKVVRLANLKAMASIFASADPVLVATVRGSGAGCSGV